MYIRKRLENANFIFNNADRRIRFTKDEANAIIDIDYSKPHDDIIKELISVLNHGDLQFDESSSLFKLECDYCEKDCLSVVVIQLEDDFNSEELVCKDCLLQLITEM